MATTTEIELIGLVAEKLYAAGWDLEVEKVELGLQLDLFATRDGTSPIVIECKAFQKLVGLRTAREFASVVEFLRESNPELQAWLVATSGFTSNAAEALRFHGIECLTLADINSRYSAAKRKSKKTKTQWSADAVASRENKKRVFVVMPFDDEMLDVFILGIRWVANEIGLVAERADDLEHQGEIIDEIKNAISSYDIVVGDTTDANPNVCYEIGYAHALHKPTILICRKGRPLPFDLQGTNHLFYSNVLELRKRLLEKLTAVIGKQM